MAVLTVKKNVEFADYTPGWKVVVIEAAKRGAYDQGTAGGKKYLDLFFEGYPENIKLRVHQKFNKTTNEEFNIANAFRYANAGIKDASESETEMRVEIDITPENIIGKKLNVYFYKKANGYTEVSDNVAPGEPFENIVETFDESRIENFKKYTFENRIKPYVSTISSDGWDSPSENGDGGPPEEKEEDWS